jgi:hypothetical protein
MVYVIVVGSIAFVVFAVILGHVIWSTTDRQLRRTARQSAIWQVDRLFAQARIRMDEAAGRRRPGERRIEDGFGSWRNW